MKNALTVLRDLVEQIDNTPGGDDRGLDLLAARELLQANPRPRKKANFLKFKSAFLKCYKPGEVREAYIHDQYAKLTSGIRDVRIADTGCSAWEQGGGEW